MCEREIGFTEDIMHIFWIVNARNFSTILFRRVDELAMGDHETHMIHHIFLVRWGHPLEKYEISSFSLVKWDNL